MGTKALLPVGAIVVRAGDGTLHPYELGDVGPFYTVAEVISLNGPQGEKDWGRAYRLAAYDEHYYWSTDLGDGMSAVTITEPVIIQDPDLEEYELYMPVTSGDLRGFTSVEL